RRGDYSPELFLDLHGLTQLQAKQELGDIPVIWASTPARELGTTLADRMMQKITHEETHSRNLIIPARLIAAK
nr:hypothetical protein [Escherichia coli]